MKSHVSYKKNNEVTMLKLFIVITCLFLSKNTLMSAEILRSEQKNNHDTIAAYESHIQEYIDNTPQTVNADCKIWIDNTLSLIPKDGIILELGSAFGRDASYFKSMEYQVKCTDAAQGFVEYLKNHGYDACLLNAITDPFNGSYSMIFANGVFLHFTPEELSTVLSKSYDALQEKGILAFSVKLGTGSEWAEDKLGAPRFYCYWQLDSLELLLKKFGFTIHTFSNNKKWLYIIAEKA